MNLLYALIFKQSLETNSNKMKKKGKAEFIVLKNIFLMIYMVISFTFKTTHKKVAKKNIRQMAVRNIVDLNEYKIKKAK